MLDPAGPPPIMPTSKSGADEFMSAAFSQKMFVKTGTPAIFYNWYHHPNGAEVSGLLITARFEKALSAVPPITGSKSQVEEKCRSFGGGRYFFKRVVFTSKPEIAH